MITHHPIVTVNRGNVSGFPIYCFSLATRRMTKSYERNRTRVLAWPHACGSRANRVSAIGRHPSITMTPYVQASQMMAAVNASSSALQRAFRLHLLSPALCFQSVWRPGAEASTSWQRSQRRRLAIGSWASCRALSRPEHSPLLPRRRRLCQAGDLEAEGYIYAIRLPTNPILQKSVAHLLTRPVGRPPNWRPGKLCPRVGFIVTNLRPTGQVCAAKAGVRLSTRIGLWVGFSTAKSA